MGSLSLSESYIQKINSYIDKDPFSQTARPNIGEVSFSKILQDIISRLSCKGRLLDIGANNGLIDIALAPFYDHILAVEPATEMYAVLKRNVANIPNIKTEMAW